MKAMVLHITRPLDGKTASRNYPLEPAEVPDPVPEKDEILLRISVCGVCHTELDEIEGRLPPSRLPIILGHQVIGSVMSAGKGNSRFTPGERVGIAWIYSACGECEFCRNGNENLCRDFKGTGKDANGGYAEFMTVPGRFAYAIPPVFSDAEAAPLLCAGAIGYRSLRLAALHDGQNLGLTGFGASGHLTLTMARHLYPHTNTFVFARNEAERTFARELGAAWTGSSEEAPPALLHAIIDTTPVWSTVLAALKNLQPGGRLVINAIRKEGQDIDQLTHLEYPIHLWQEKEIKSVANVTRRDVEEFLALAARIGIRPEIEEYPLDRANDALIELKTKKIRGAKVLRIA